MYANIRLLLSSWHHLQGPHKDSYCCWESLRGMALKWAKHKAIETVKKCVGALLATYKHVFSYKHSTLQGTNARTKVKELLPPQVDMKF